MSAEAAFSATPSFTISPHITTMVERGVDMYEAMLLERSAAVTHPAEKAGLDGFQALFRGGGKRLRGVLAVKGYGMWLGEAACNPNVPSLAAGLAEIEQAYLLSFDDITDHATERRGAPAAHIVAERGIAQASDFQGDPAWTGQECTRYAAMSIQHWAQDFFAEQTLAQEVPAEHSQLALRILNRTLGETGIGQIKDLISAGRTEIEERDIVAVALAKTAHYSIRMPWQVGGAVAGASKEQLDLIVPYAEETGLAFQYRDDYLGIWGDQRTMGKPANDLQQGKHTLFVARALKRATPVERQTLLDTLGNPDASADALARCRDIILTTGALDSVVAETNARADAACEALSVLADHVPPADIRFLAEFALYSASRVR